MFGATADVRPRRRASSSSSSVGSWFWKQKTDELRLSASYTDPANICPMVGFFASEYASSPSIPYSSAMRDAARRSCLFTPASVLEPSARDMLSALLSTVW